MDYKLSLIGTLVHRVYMICNTWDTFHDNIEALKHILKNNLFPPNIIDRQVKTYLDKQLLMKKGKRKWILLVTLNYHIYLKYRKELKNKFTEFPNLTAKGILSR